MIPKGWVLVPVIPTERMLNEFSGVWWPNLGMNELRQWTGEKRLLEEQSYAAMIAVAPTPPKGEGASIESLKSDIKRKTRIIRSKDAEINRAYKKLKNAFDRIRRLEAENEELRRLDRRNSGDEQGA